MNRREILGAAAVAGAGLVENTAAAQDRTLRVVVWSERTEPTTVYPAGINGLLAGYLSKQPGITAKAATLTDDDQGISDAVLANTDVLIWWGHQKHAQVRDDRVDAVVRRVKENGLGVIALHSAHYSKILKKTLNTSGDLGGWGDGGQETVYVVNPAHPIAKGITDFALPREEYYDEPFGIPEPSALVFLSVFSNPDKGKVRRFRSGACFEVGKGRLFYFRPGHEEYPTFFDETVQKVIHNATLWTARRS